MRFQEFNKFFDQLPQILEIATTLFEKEGDVAALGLLNIDISKLDCFRIIVNDIAYFLSSIWMYHEPREGQYRNYDKIHGIVNATRNKLVLTFRDLRERILDYIMLIPTVSVSDIDNFLALIEITVNVFRNKIYDSCNMNCRSLQISSAVKMFLLNFTELSVDQFTSELIKYYEQNVINIYKNLLLFQNNPALRSQYEQVYLFFKHLAVFPFEEPVTHCASLYKIRLIQKLLENSAWSELGDVTSHILMILSELGTGEKISEMDMFSW